MFAWGREIQENINTVAEAIMAMLEALRYYVAHNYTRILLQTDSMLLINVVEGHWSSPLNVVRHVEDIRAIMESCEVRVSYIMRGGNKLEDHIANYALDTGPIEANGFVDLDKEDCQW